MSKPGTEWNGKFHPTTFRGIRHLNKKYRGIKGIGHWAKLYLGHLVRQERKDKKERDRGFEQRLTTLSSSATGIPLGSSVAIYAHFNGSAGVSRMVLKQLRALRNTGFKIVFVSMSQIDDEGTRTALSGVVDYVHVRQSFGRDFGAWHDAWMYHRQEMKASQEILLVNDSMLGPIRPLTPVIEGMRSLEGVLGLIDSPDTIGHLQSFFLLFRGGAAINVLDTFFDEIRLSFHKRTMIERGELGIARAIRASGLPYNSAFSFEEAEARAVSDLVFIERLNACCPKLFSGVDLPEPSDHIGIRRLKNHLRTALWRVALNPTHYYWRVLVEEMGFPFLKTELVLSNPTGMPDVADWPLLIDDSSYVSLEDIREHLEMVAA